MLMGITIIIVYNVHYDNIDGTGNVDDVLW